jgi:hypothetical protein
VEIWLGLTALKSQTDLESCPRSAKKGECSHD